MFDNLLKFDRLPGHPRPTSKARGREEVIERSDLYKRWQRLRPPLRPHAADIATIDQLTYGRGPRLLLGVTPELAALGGPLIAVDWSATMIARIWPGNSADRRAVQGDWRKLPLAPQSVTGAMGDGIVNMLRWPDEVETVVQQLRETVRPGGRIALRCFCSSDERESLEALHSAYLSPSDTAGFHAFKWRLAQAAMRGDNIETRAVWAAFEATFPDREALSRATGWPLSTIGEIDDYRVSTLSKCFPTRSALKSLLPDAYLVESQGYEMAERCPVLVIDL